MSTNKKGITVRFEDDEMESLELLAKKYKVSSATIIRWALTALNDYVEANNGRVVLPLDFSEFLSTRQATELRAVADEPNPDHKQMRQGTTYQTKNQRGAKS